MAHIAPHLTVIPVECPYCCHVFDCVVHTSTFVLDARVVPQMEFTFQEHACGTLQELKDRR